MWTENLSFDAVPLPKFTEQPLYLNFGGGSYYYESLNRTALAVTFTSWHQQTYTYDRSLDNMNFYIDGELMGNCTLGMGKGTGNSYAAAPTKLGWFGATSDKLGIEWWR